LIVRLSPLALLLLLGGCKVFLAPDLPDEPPPLVDMEAPLALFAEPDDEERRRALDAGSFTGVQVVVARSSLEDEGTGLLVRQVIENSPADIAGIAVDDILLFAVDHEGEEHALAWPSQWRKIELDAPPDSELTVFYDRAGVEREARIVTIPRVRLPGREESARYREELRVGVVLRTATEVEARAAGLGPGAGAVIVGLSLDSPFRAAGLRFGDLIVEVEGTEVSHPQAVLNAIRDGDDEIALRRRRDGSEEDIVCPLSRRKSTLTEIYIPLLFSYESDRGMSELSLLFGLFRRRATPAAWELRLLWFIRFRGGDADRLEEVSGR
jgi:C-terminal processing protease CtpA/Prc